MKRNTISIFVKEQRKKNGLTQEMCAIYAGVGLAFLRALEQGKTTIKVENVNKVLNLFGAELGPVEMKKSAGSKPAKNRSHPQFGAGTVSIR